MKFFFDASVPKRLAHAVRILETGSGNEIVYKPEKFPGRGIQDKVWIAALGAERDWIVITLDYSILRNAHERAAWDVSGLTGFFFDGSWGNLKIDDLAWQFLRWWPVIKQTAAAVSPGSAFVVRTKFGRTLRPLASVRRRPRSNIG